MMARLKVVCAVTIYGSVWFGIAYLVNCRTEGVLYGRLLTQASSLLLSGRLQRT